MPDVVSTHQPVLGTVLQLRITAANVDEAAAAERHVLAEIAALQERLTWFTHTSEFSRWRAGEVPEPSAVLTDLLAIAEQWQRRSAGAFNPAAGVLSQRWRRAADEGVAPTPEEMADLATTIAAPRFSVEDGRVSILGDVTDLNLNAVAKGFVVDRAAEAAWSTFELDALVVNAGGDLRRIGEGSITVGIENPLRPYDNEPPLDRIRLGAGALATSGSARRWFEVGGSRVSQVLDPRTGWPVDDAASVSVVAADATTADVAATVAAVLGDAPEDTACLRVASDGTVAADARWVDLRA